MRRFALVPVIKNLVVIVILTLLATASVSARADEAERSSAPSPPVQIGLHVRAISAIDDAARSFDVDFDLWLRFAGPKVVPELEFLDATKSVTLGNPIQEFDQESDHYRLYHSQATLRYRVSKSDLVKNTRTLRIRIGAGRRGHAALQLDVAETDRLPKNRSAFFDQLREDDVVASLDVWSLDGGELAIDFAKEQALGDPKRRDGKQERPILVASLIVRQDVVSPRILFEAIRPAPASFWPLLIVLALIACTFVQKLGERWPALRLAAQLLLSCVAFYFAEALLRAVAVQHLGSVGLEIFLPVCLCIYWVLPAVALHALLPPLVWEPLGHRSGHPVPAITRTLVNLLLYMAACLCALRFVFGQSLTTVWAASGVVTVVLGLALQNLILDAFSGLMINIERPFRILQWIRLKDGMTDGIEGQVIDMNWRVTQLLTRSNDVLSIPNSQVVRSGIINYALPSPVSLLSFDVEIDEKLGVRQAQRFLKEGVLAAADQGRVLATPQPRVMVEAPSGQRVRYKVEFFANLALVSARTACTDAVEGVIERLTREGIMGARYIASGEPAAVASRTVQAEAATEKQPKRDAENDAAQHAPVSEPADAPITAEQIRLVQESWAKVVPIADAAAKLFYERLFTLDASLKPLFRTEPQKQRTKLVAMLGLTVKGLTHLDGLIATVQDLGLRHISYGVKASHYDTVGEALLWTLAKGLGADFTTDVKAAWVRAYTVLSAAMKAAN